MPPRGRVEGGHAGRTQPARSITPELRTTLLQWRARVRKPGTWRERTLEKPNGKSRHLLVPVRALKHVLREVNRELLAPLDRHPASYCRRNRGVLLAIRGHQHHPALLHRDISDFFPSVRPWHVSEALQRCGFDTDDAALITAVVTANNQLPQGSPASVTVGNLVLRTVDIRLWALAKKHGLTYTRYVDDIVLSGGEGRLRDAERLIDRIIEDCGWTCGADKARLYPPSYYREVLGVSVAGAAKPGHKSRRKIEQAERMLQDGEIPDDQFASLFRWRDAVLALGARIDNESLVLPKAADSPRSKDSATE